MNRESRDDLIEVLENHGAEFRGYGNDCTCPFHEDDRASAGVYVDDKGIWRFKCRVPSCGESGDIYDMVTKLDGVDARPGKTPVTSRGWDDVPSMLSSFPAGSSFYPYDQHEEGDWTTATLRTPEKAFSCVSRDKTGRILPEKEKGSAGLYGALRARRDSGPIIAVEGEKCVDALNSIGFLAVTSFGGSGGAERADWSVCEGREVYLWPDNDEAGRMYMETVASMLSSLAAAVYLLDPAELELEDKEDAADVVEDFEEPANDVRYLMKRARPLSLTPMDEVMEEIAEIEKGNRIPVSFPFPSLTNESRALVPGSVTLICGDPGDGKSFLLTQMMMHWALHGIKFAAYELEESLEFWARRICAQLDEDSRLTDHMYLHHNPGKFREAAHRHTAELETIVNSISTSGAGTSQAELLDWAEEKAKCGCDVLAIDPLTAADVKGNQWEQDLNFMMKIKGTAKRYNIPVVLVTHPKQGSKSSGLGSLAGGSAFSRFAACVLWIKRRSEGFSGLSNKVDPKTFITKKGHRFDANRELVIIKARNGPGAGKRIAYNFCGETLLFFEEGVITDVDDH